MNGEYRITCKQRLKCEQKAIRQKNAAGCRNSIHWKAGERSREQRAELEAQGASILRNPPSKSYE